MDAIVWGGIVLSLIGLAGIVGCILAVWRAKRAGLDDAALRARLQRVVAWNLAALMTSGLGLGLVAVGLLAGG
jgi:hypothetical protein